MPFSAKAGVQVTAFFESSTKLSGNIDLTIDGISTTSQNFDAHSHCTFAIPAKASGSSSNVTYTVQINLGTAPISLTLTLKQNGTVLTATAPDTNPTTNTGLVLGFNPTPGAYTFILDFL